MPIQAHDVETLHRYAAGVMDRAGHHAGNVGSIALALLGAIVWRGDPGSIEIRQHDGGPANVLWVTINGTRYAFSYNHQEEAIEMRDRTVRGEVLHRFSNQTRVTALENIFRQL